LSGPDHSGPDKIKKKIEVYNTVEKTITGEEILNDRKPGISWNYKRKARRIGINKNENPDREFCDWYIKWCT